MRLSRRALLAGAAGATGLAVSGCSDWSPSQTGELVKSGLELPKRFQVPLPVPQPLRPASTSAAGDVFEIVQREVELEILPGVRTTALTYGGTFPGPLLETRTGRPATIKHRNAMPVPSVVHLHGGHTPSDSDGFPTDLVEPGADRSYTYPMTQRASTLWYHDHRMDFTGEQVYRGLVGVHLIRDDEDDALPLPKDEREIPLVIVDRSFDEHGQFAYPAAVPGRYADHGDHSGHHGGGSNSRDPQFGADDGHVEGVLGDVILVNGAPWPVLEVDAARYRFRILNGCNARRLDLALDPAPPRRTFVQVGSDGGLLEKPIGHDHLVVAQAERFDVVVDFSSYDVGQEVTMVNRIGSGSTAQIMRFVVARKATDDSAPTDKLGRLSTIEPLDTSGARRRLWKFGKGDPSSDSSGDAWTVNNKLFDPEEPQARVPLGEVEIWRFRSDMFHPVHVHLDPFQVLSRHGKELGDFDHGWKDTVDVRPGEEVEVAVRFTQHRGRYVLHCHNLEHEDRMMMAAFETV
ncbi:multicopper oxidase family protein [Nocardioides speluncae]|uniref:multicopper oxidase family protein n=1 Tax=Nocardioides speluncae TaxID=2670337 RepID=UPI000D68AD34|nr:multicopper oxidase domain-containing protein [Nocardioides speluncae]